MPIRFKKSESATKAVKRVYRERVRAALGRLRKCPRSAAVHGVRKEIKKLRALFRLVREHIGRGVYRKHAKALREVAASLTTPRDARVRLKAFEKLAGRGSRRFVGVEKALRKNWRQETRRFLDDDSVALTNRILRKTNRRIGDIKIKPAGWAAIEPGLRRSYQRGRDAFEFVRRKPHGKYFHEWRKHVKDLWYYFRLLHPAWSAEMRTMTSDLELLGEQLGDDHDLVLLQQFAATHCVGLAGEVEALNRLIESRQKQLRAAALKLGLRLYAITPTVICRRLEKEWNLWRRE